MYMREFTVKETSVAARRDARSTRLNIHSLDFLAATCNILLNFFFSFFPPCFSFHFLISFFLQENVILC